MLACCRRQAAACLIFLFLGAQPSLALTEEANEHTVKAGIIFNLLLFAQWPDKLTQSPEQTLCVLEEGSMLNSLRRHAGRKINAQTLRIELRTASSEGLSGCQAVFVEIGNPIALSRAAALARQTPLLVIGEGSSALNKGAMIAINTDGGKVAFDINLDSLRRAQLGLSSKLLKLAHLVVE
jgi:hypothetical protein